MYRIWLSGTMLLLSVVVWFAITSSWAIILHSVAKLGPTTSKYGTVNFVLLFSALSWSFVGWIVIKKAFDVSISLKSLACFGIGILAIVIFISAAAFVLDGWLSQSALLGAALEALELCLAIWISGAILSKKGGIACLPEASLFGLLGLIAVTTMVLLIFPRVTFRI